MAKFEGNLGTHLLLLLVAVIWGTTWAVARFLSYGLDESTGANLGPATAAWLRYLVVVIAFVAWCWAYKNRNGPRMLPHDSRSWRYTVWLGLLGTMAYQLLFMHGMKWTAAGDASLIIPVNPVFTVLLAAPMLGQKVTKRMAFGLLLGIVGVSVVVGWSPNTDIPFEHRLLGDAMIVLAALAWATNSNLTKIALEEDGIGTTEELVIWYSIVGWIMLTPWMLAEIWDTGIPNPNTAEWGSIVYLGLFSTVLTYVWFARGIDRIGPTAAASYVFLVPIFGVLSGWALLDESIGASMLVGFVLIVMGVREVQRESERVRVD
jgi:drug/metabolite transporter (DMT)-like permease|uniref:Permeases of the drug/metabolite transporter family protein, permease component n=2 Tax=environmental samples TaxID=68359 RepID=A0A075I3P5_9EURY|nr:Permeases of the drug/metabolite transporter family protein, permease component [uncultured marine group II/III euryarchaeote SAT1000_14_G12]AIF23658.1 Permeases of the drug/metabolite transporter family protein, permease component [uncultured marine group II/III euryarchaeote SAT1000_17_H07]